jgi:hypothetical protein
LNRQRSREPGESLPGPKGYENVWQQHGEHWAPSPLSEVTTQSSAHRHGAEYYFQLQHSMHKIKTKFVPICNVMQRVLPDCDKQLFSVKPANASILQKSVKLHN